MPMNGGCKGYPVALPAPAPSDNVWVGDLPIGMDQQTLGATFSAYGQIVDCKMLPGRDSMSKPCALIRFATVEQAAWFVENLHGNIPEGLQEPVICRFANAPSKGKGKEAFFPGGAVLPPPNTPPPVRSAPYNGGAYVGGKGALNMQGSGDTRMSHSFEVFYGAVQASGMLGGSAVPDDCSIFVQNLPFDATDVDLYRLFAPFGAIGGSGVKAILDDDGSCKGMGFVDYTEPASAANAVLALEGFALPDGSAISVSIKGQQSMHGKGIF
jgi:RNA recognition motif-containing protein